ncbi:MAG: type II toxin-antitoxin system RelE/ParE family toxin [Steroidobacteraceae bacterium]|nr:type II toxin-antitoxin system RelE/ParE family toxin [Steroidobacteraceae bacterium]
MSSAWTIEFAAGAAQQLRKLDRLVARRIVRFLRERVATAPDPRSLGAALKGDDLGRYWKYRVGDYRVIAEIRDREVRIIAVRLGHRSDVYR